MAVTVHSHVLGSNGAPDSDQRATLREALRVGDDQLGDDAADGLYLVAYGLVEAYTGRLVSSRDATVILEVTTGRELVDPAGWWRPAMNVTTLERWAAATATWGADELGDHTAADPLGRYHLEAGWWRFTGTQGDTRVGDDWEEALHRVAAWLFDTDPSRPERAAARSNVVRLSGAAMLLGRYTVRGAHPIGGS